MKNLSLFLILFVSFYSQSQISYDFSEPLPPKAKNLLWVDPMYYGVYKNTTQDFYYEINDSGIWIISMQYSSISRETIRESSVYSVRNNYLFGVLKNDSIPCVLENERYYFALKNKEQIIGKNTKNVLTYMENGKYILNYSENGNYIPCFLHFKNNQLLVSHFDYPNDSSAFSSISVQTKVHNSQMELIHLKPSLKEWNKMDKKLIQGSVSIFIKE